MQQKHTEFLVYKKDEAQQHQPFLAHEKKNTLRWLVGFFNFLKMKVLHIFDEILKICKFRIENSSVRLKIQEKIRSDAPYIFT